MDAWLNYFAVYLEEAHMPAYSADFCLSNGAIVYPCSEGRSSRRKSLGSSPLVMLYLPQINQVIN
jgi:hypothetical protein